MKTGRKFECNEGKEISEVDENILPPPTYIEIDNNQFKIEKGSWD
jgi:hypothetical protein